MADIYNKEELKDSGMGYKLPPRFLWIPSRHLFRVAIIRASYIKDVDKFISQNTKMECEVTLDGFKMVKQKLGSFEMEEEG